MTPPEALTRDTPLLWSPGRGTEVWALFQACVAGDLETVRSLLDRDPSLARCHFEYRTPLYFAVRENRFGVVRLLIERGADPLSLAIDDSLLEIARDRGFLELEDWLRSALARHQGAGTGGEPVAAAIRSRDPEAVLRLLDASPDLLHAGDARSNQPIHWAVMTRQPELIEALLDRGARINARRFDGARPIHLTNGDYFHRGGRDVPSTVTASPDDIYRLLVRRGAEVDLGMAAAKGDQERVREILDRDPAAANRVSEYGSYYLGCGAPLKNAAATGQLEIVRLLLERGADPNLPEEGIAPHGHALYAAVAAGHEEIVRLLLAHGAHPNPEVESSADALSRALWRKDARMADLLCAHGAARSVSLLAHDNDLRTAAAVFTANPALADDPEALGDAASPEFVRLMVRFQPGLPARVALAKDPDTTEWLFQHGMDPNRPDWLGSTALHRFARRGEIEAAQAFLRHGADLHARDEIHASSPLGVAAKFGKLSMVEFLLRQGARVRLPDDPPWATPVAWAERRGHDEVAATLRHHERWGVPPLRRTTADFEAVAADLVEAHREIALWAAAERAVLEGDADSLDRLLAPEDSLLRRQTAPPYVPSGPAPDYRSAGAREIIAREQHFASWADWAAHQAARRTPGSPTARFEDAVEAVVEGHVDRLRALLASHPDLVRQRSERTHRATLLHYLGANGIEGFRQRTPPQAAEIAALLLAAGSEVDAVAAMYGGATPLALVATSLHPSRAGLHRPLLQLLHEHGADLDLPQGGGQGLPPVHGALAHGRIDAARCLAQLGARLDLEAAAGLGNLDEVRARLPGPDGQPAPPAPPPGSESRLEAAFRRACQFGHLPVVSLLLEHQPSLATVRHPRTGLHEAAFGGHPEVVRRLIAQGAPVDAEDDTWHATPLGWALHGWSHPPEGATLARYAGVVSGLVDAGASVRPEWRREGPWLRDPRLAAILRRKDP